jgi:hypothetical protein
MGKCDRIEVLLWSIALPGFGQILNGNFLKGLLLIGLEFMINVQSNLNEVIRVRRVFRNDWRDILT